MRKKLIKLSFEWNIKAHNIDFRDVGDVLVNGNSASVP